MQTRTEPQPAHDPLLWLIMVFFGAMLGALSVLRYVGYNAGMLDLGNMCQAIASVLRGQPMVFTYVDGPTSRLAFHVELFYLLLVPLWAIWPDPRGLLIAQTALFAAGAIPAYRLGARVTGGVGGGRALALIYLLYPVAQTAVLFDLHGDTLAMPLLLFALEALDRRAWRSFAVWAILAVSCKFYVAAPIGLAGLVAWWGYGERRIGLITFAAALAYGLIAFLVIRPLFTTASTSEAHSGLSYLSFYFGRLEELAESATGRIRSAIVVFGPAMLLVWHGRRWLLPALPIALAALLSTGPGGSYDYRYHHYAVVVPFVIMAAAQGLAHVRAQAEAGRGRRFWRVDLAVTTGLVAVLGIWLVDTPLNPQFWSARPGRGLDPSAFEVTSRDAVKDTFLATHVPAGAPLAASVFLAPHLVERDTLYLIRYPDDPGGERLPLLLPKVDYAIADALFDWRAIAGGNVVAGPPYERTEIGQLLRDPAFGLVAADDGLLLFQRGAASPLAQSARAVPDAGGAPIARLGPTQLLAYRIKPLGGRRFRASFLWRLEGEVPPRGLVAVSRLAEIQNARIVHLPTYALMPLGRWQPGQTIEERFELEIPERVPAGSYSWLTGWYDLGHPEAYTTDARSSVGKEVTVGVVTVP